MGVVGRSSDAAGRGGAGGSARRVGGGGSAATGVAFWIGLALRLAAELEPFWMGLAKTVDAGEGEPPPLTTARAGRVLPMVPCNGGAAWKPSSDPGAGGGAAWGGEADLKGTLDTYWPAAGGSIRRVSPPTEWPEASSSERRRALMMESFENGLSGPFDDMPVVFS